MGLNSAIEAGDNREFEVNERETLSSRKGGYGESGRGEWGVYDMDFKEGISTKNNLGRGIRNDDCKGKEWRPSSEDSEKELENK